MEDLFGGNYSGLEQCPSRRLTLQNIKAKKKYIEHIQKEFNTQKIMERAYELYQSTFQDTNIETIIDKLIELDKLVTVILLTGEK